MFCYKEIPKRQNLENAKPYQNQHLEHCTPNNNLIPSQIFLKFINFSKFINLIFHTLKTTSFFFKKNSCLSIKNSTLFRSKSAWFKIPTISLFLAEFSSFTKSSPACNRNSNFKRFSESGYWSKFIASKQNLNSSPQIIGLYIFE